jgi:predicted Holliday junction resolvase-like endonuclease
MHLNNKPIIWFVLIVCLLLMLPIHGQTRAVKKAERKRELIKKLEKKYYEKSRKKAIKHHREIQSETTRKRMDEIDKKARENNRQDFVFWPIKWFKRKKAKR